MDSQVQVEGRLLDIVTDDWRKEKWVKINRISIYVLIIVKNLRLTIEDIPVPFAELPDPESDTGNPGETLRQQENKWTDLSLTGLAETFSAN